MDEKKEVLLKVENLRQYFKMGKKELKAVDDVSFEIYKGEVFGLVGESGCGKTTLLKTVAGILAPQGGSIRLGGEDITGLPPHRRGVVILFQDIRLRPALQDPLDPFFNFFYDHIFLQSFMICLVDGSSSSGTKFFHQSIGVIQARPLLQHPFILPELRQRKMILPRDGIDLLTAF